MNTITQDAVVKLAEIQEALDWLAVALDSNEQIGLATILKILTGRLIDEVFSYIRPIKEEGREGAQ